MIADVLKITTEGAEFLAGVCRLQFSTYVSVKIEQLTPVNYRAGYVITEPRIK